MFNFAIAGSLEKYQPTISYEPAIKAISSTSTDSQIATRPNTPESFESVLHAPSKTKQALIKRYASNEEAPQQRRRAWTVGDLMTKSVKTLHPEDPIAQAFDLVQRMGFRHIPITDGQGKIAGLLSDRDLLKIRDEQTKSKLISSVMTQRVLTCFSETPLRLAASTMLKEGFSSLPVVDHQGFLRGLLTTGDILKALVNEAPLDLWT